MKYIALIAALLLPAQLAAQTVTIAPAATATAEVAVEAEASASVSAEQEAVLKHLAKLEKTDDITPLIGYLTGTHDLASIDEQTRKKAEAALLAHTKPLPASNAKANLEGYQALASLVPDSDTYRAKVRSYQTKYDNQRYAVLRKLKKKHSEFDSIDWYQHPRKPRYADTRSYLLPYMGAKEGHAWLRAKLHYTSDSWLFVEYAKANIDGEEVRLPFGDWKRDNDSEIWEWSDELMTDSMRGILERIANSKKTIIRFYGMKFYDDWTVPSRDKQAILEMFAAEEAMKEKLTSG